MDDGLAGSSGWGNVFFFFIIIYPLSSPTPLKTLRSPAVKDVRPQRLKGAQDAFILEVGAPRFGRRRCETVFGRQSFDVLMALSFGEHQTGAKEDVLVIWGGLLAPLVKAQAGGPPGRDGSELQGSGRFSS